MSSNSYDCECPNCHKQMLCCMNNRPFDSVDGECLYCGFNYYTKTYFDTFENLNERRKDFGKKPLIKKQYDKIKRDISLGKVEK